MSDHARRALCATDFSNRSERALRAAVALADRADARLTLLHVLESGASSTARKVAEEQLQEQVRRSAVSRESIRALAIRAGHPEKIIAQVALQTRAQLIVMGAPRKRTLAALRGTTPERVLALARCPAIIVRSTSAIQYARVVVATDLEPAIRDIVRFANRWSFLDSPRVSIVHGFESPYQGPLYAEGFDLKAARRHIAQWQRRAREHVRSHLKAAGVRPARFDVQIEERRPLPLVRQALGRAGSSLLIIGGSQHTVISRLARGSFANDALRRLDCDVLIYPAARGRDDHHIHGRRKRDVARDIP
jgi:nucleotide-binding universal stress UspA family protein